MTKLTKDQWQCYLDTPDFVVDNVNCALTFLLDANSDPKEAQVRMYTFLERYAKHGFLDSECMQVVTDEINKHFYDHENIDRWSRWALA